MYRGEVSRADMRIWITLVMGASTDKVWYIFELLVRRTIFPMKIDTEFASESIPSLHSSD